jgi:hypothetical protein
MLTGREWLTKRTLRASVHLVVDVRSSVGPNLEKLAKGVVRSRILEIRSGWPDLCQDAFCRSRSVIFARKSGGS